MKLRESLLSRRQFLSGVLVGGAAAAGVSLLYPTIQYLFYQVKLPLPKKIAIPAVAAKTVEVNSAKYFSYGWMPAILVRRKDGSYVAFNAVCTHLDCTVVYQPETGGFFCNCHNGVYDSNGTNISGPPPRPLERLDVVVEADGRVVVSRQEKVENA